jgi:hypothetical protein
LVQHRSIVAAGAVTERAGQPGFACPRRPGYEQILMAFDPLASGETLKHRAVEAAGNVMIDVFRCGLLTQTCEPQPGGQAFAVALQSLAIHQHGKAVLKAEIGRIRVPSLLLERASHASKAEFAQAIRGGVGQHGCSSPQW